MYIKIANKASGSDLWSDLFMNALLGLNLFNPATESLDLTPILNAHNHWRLYKDLVLWKNKILLKHAADLELGCDL